MSETDKIQQATELPKAHKHTTRKGFGLFGSSVANWIVALSTIGAGIGGSWISLNKSFWGNAEKDRMLASEWEKRDARRRELSTDHSITGEPLRRQLAQAEETYHAAKEVVIRRRGIKGPLQRLETLGHHQKWEVAFAGAATFAVALGVATTFFGNVRSAHTQKEIADELENNKITSIER